MKINTYVKNENNYLSILNSILGQLSDGIWENSRAAEKYWKSLSINVDDDNFITYQVHIVKDNDFTASNMRYMDAMNDFLEANDLPFLCDVDTRMLAKVIRDEGSMLGIITDVNTTLEEALEKINAYQPVRNMVKKLSTKRPYIIKANKPKSKATINVLIIRHLLYANIIILIFLNVKAFSHTIHIFINFLIKITLQLRKKVLYFLR